MYIDWCERVYSGCIISLGSGPSPQSVTKKPPGALSLAVNNAIIARSFQLKDSFN